MELLVPEEEMAQRRAAGVVKPDHPAPGLLAAYRRSVQSAETGALWL